jgi:hypothetical protein
VTHSIPPISVNHRSSWGGEIEGFFARRNEVLAKYFEEEARLFNDERGSIARILSPNTLSSLYRSLLEEELPAAMRGRDLVAFHYSRLCDVEVEFILSDGMKLSSVETMQDRLGRLVSAGHLGAQEAKRLFGDSVLHDKYQAESRVGMIWMVSEFLPPEHRGVDLLLGSWGGESVYWNAIDESSKHLLSRIGVPTVVVARIDIEKADIGYQLSKALIDKVFMPSDCETQIDICLRSPLPASRILRVGAPHQVAEIYATGVTR